METPKDKTKRVAKNSVFMYIRMFALMLIGLYTSRVTLDVLGVEDFGIYNLVGGIITLTAFINNAMALAVNRYLAYAMGKNDFVEMKRVFSMSLNLHMIIAAIVLFLGETVGLWFINTHLVIPAERMDAANWIYQASIITFVSSILTTPYQADIIAHERMNFYAFTGILSGVLKLLIVLVLPLLMYDKLIVFAILLCLSSVLCSLLSIVFVKINFEESKYILSWDAQLIKNMTKYAGYSTFGNMATAVVNQGQSILINIFYGPSLNAVRGLSLQVNSAVCQFINGIYTAVTPQITKTYAQNDREYLLKLIYYSTILTFALIFTVTLPLFLEIDFVLGLWLKEVPEFTNTFVRLVLINSIVFYFTTPSMIGIQSSGDVGKMHVSTGIVNLLNIIIVYLLWKLIFLPPYTIFMVQIFISFCMACIVTYLQQLQLSISIKDYIKNVILPCVFPALIAIIVPTVIFNLMISGWIRFVVVCIISIFSSLFCFYFMSVNKEMRRQIKTFICNKIKKD